MIFLAAALAYAGACDPAAAVARLRTDGAREDYTCVIEDDGGRALLEAELVKGAEGTERLTRALALWLLARTDQPMDPAVVDKLAPSDRRLLADGIRARRGRASPAPDHARVFEQFDWYAPVAGYTDARLRPIDRENLEVVDPWVRLTPPPAPPPQAPPEKAEEAPAPEGPNLTQALCGCGSTGAAPVGLAFVGALAAVVGRRRRA
ncbi:MAG: MYXO-CTERM sorting domain-containing protein [Myxococcota bacterium]